jgi:hypothetical protein
MDGGGYDFDSASVVDGTIWRIRRKSYRNCNRRSMILFERVSYSKQNCADTNVHFKTLLVTRVGEETLLFDILQQNDGDDTATSSVFLLLQRFKNASGFFTDFFIVSHTSSILCNCCDDVV